MHSKTRETIVKLIRLMTSDKDGEALAAMKKVLELLKRENLTLESFFFNSDTSNRDIDSAYQRGHVKGYSEGMNHGKAEGRNAGILEGKKIFEMRLKALLQVEYTKGFDEGKRVGYTEGYANATKFFKSGGKNQKGQKTNVDRNLEELTNGFNTLGEVLKNMSKIIGDFPKETESTDEENEESTDEDEDDDSNFWEKVEGEPVEEEPKNYSGNSFWSQWSERIKTGTDKAKEGTKDYTRVTTAWGESSKVKTNTTSTEEYSKEEMEFCQTTLFQEIIRDCTKKCTALISHYSLKGYKTKDHEGYRIVHHFFARHSLNFDNHKGVKELPIIRRIYRDFYLLSPYELDRLLKATIRLSKFKNDINNLLKMPSKSKGLFLAFSLDGILATKKIIVEGLTHAQIDLLLSEDLTSPMKNHR